MITYPLSKRLQALQKYPCGLNDLNIVFQEQKKRPNQEYIDCSLGEVLVPLLDPIKRRGIEAINGNHNRYVKPFWGLEKLRISLAKKFLKENLNIHPENILVTAGSELGMDLVFRSLLNPSDEVVIFDPFFPPFVINVLAYGAKPIFIDTFCSQFIPSPTLIKKNITKKTKAIVINSPNNPTGAVYPTDVLKKIIEIARKNKLIILSDEVYKDYIFERKFISIFKLYPERSIILRSCSKKYGMMGYKVGWLTGTPNLINQIKKFFIPMYSSPMISQLMAIEAIKYPLGNKVLKDFMHYRDKIFINLKRFLPQLTRPQGAFYFYLPAPGKALKFCLKLLEEGVLVSPTFSRNKTYFRMSYAGLNRKTLDKLISILKQTYMGYTKMGCHG